MATTQLYTLSLHDALPIFLHAFPVEGVDDVARTHARPRGRAVFRHVRHDDAGVERQVERFGEHAGEDRKSTRLNSSHSQISYAVFCLKKKNARMGACGNAS